MCLARDIYEVHRLALRHIATSPPALLVGLEAVEVCFWLAYKAVLPHGMFV